MWTGRRLLLSVLSLSTATGTALARVEIELSSLTTHVPKLTGRVQIGKQAIARLDAATIKVIMYL